MQKTPGNLFGVLAILVMSSLALLSILTENIPAFELTSLSFCIASIIGLVLLKKQKIPVIQLFKINAKNWIVGVSGLFGYHFFYFLAIKHAPVVEANLINYLWPLLIVLFSALLPHEKLRWFHILGSSLGLLGSYLIVSEGGSVNFQDEYIFGYLLALMAAVLWAAYSVISRTFSRVPTYAVTGFCMASAILSGICHFIFETTVIPNVTESIAILMLGLGPVGGAFYLWDYAVKNADIKLIGSMSYFTPLLSTLLLVVLGYAQLTTVISLACGFIILGSFISSAEYLKIIKKWIYRRQNLSLDP